MLKEQRHEIILEALDKFGIIKVTDLTEKLKATEMTIRRDLRFLEDRGLLIRIHGGARSVDKAKFEELSQTEKRNINISNKIEIAKVAASLIKNNDNIYIGPGTTTEHICDYIKADNIKIITNCLSIFEKCKDNNQFESILIGGRLRPKTNTFVGSFANELLSKIRVNKTFIGANGISDNNIMTSNEEEGQCQKIIMNNSIERYLICDYTKFEKEDFYTLYKLDDITALVTESNLDDDLREKYSKYCKIISE
ncbi:DeoR family transcriptional regulator [Clostridium baratii]|uniref:Lactose phosphotransferase system repressor n=1 Tax=Clostridium nitritogenes TaxID=83340 RepID=A0ABN1LPY4_9CLOT|nr:DeoR/GlpR family DNA-binding transcription regulator [Clostridium baratii]MBS6043285.1 DeoR/GlpR transcriptional regulator [Clostridium baratii]MBT9831401.1 DeoR family transcriptional regulator [Clostridium baratii]MDY3207854.1 DeoR/GlpR family DNA-binding transcription regulator [Clostridium baratii]OPF52413.1 DeoR family transcriptional regulator [Clostridium baratii]OPF55863.1 DeoR family transcriptional regulator [Clostridium baratii]